MKDADIVFPYTCPFWEESSPNSDECIHWIQDTDYVFGRGGCELGRQLCCIALDLSCPSHPKTADKFMEPICSIKNVSESELETIRANIEEFYNRMQK